MMMMMMMMKMKMKMKMMNDGYIDRYIIVNRRDVDEDDGRMTEEYYVSISVCLYGGIEGPGAAVPQRPGLRLPTGR